VELSVDVPLDRLGVPEDTVRVSLLGGVKAEGLDTPTVCLSTCIVSVRHTSAVLSSSLEFNIYLGTSGGVGIGKERRDTSGRTGGYKSGLKITVLIFLVSDDLSSSPFLSSTRSRAALLIDDELESVVSVSDLIFRP